MDFSFVFQIDRNSILAHRCRAVLPLYDAGSPFIFAQVRSLRSLGRAYGAPLSYTLTAMIPVGYMYKRVAVKPEWLKAESVIDVYSLSHCISDDFADYINFWKHNGYWLFNSPEVIEEIATRESIDLSGTTLFYYEAYEYEFDEDSNKWSVFQPEPSFVTAVLKPTNMHLEGFDVTTFCAHTSPECSPLSCNSLATEVSVNEHYLFNTFAEAKEAIENGRFKNSEPGPYRIFAVYTLIKA